MNSSNLLYDKKTLIQILSRQGVTFPSDFFDSPRRGDTLSFFEELLCLILGFDVTIRTKQDLRVFLAEHKLNVSRGTLHPEMKFVENFPVSQYVPDEGERHLTGISILMLYRYLQQFGNISGVLNVSLSDLLRPTPDRIRLLASTAVDYVLFQETYMPDALKKWGELERDRESIKALREEIKEYREAVRNILETLESKHDEIELLRNQRQEATIRLKALGEKWIRVKEECDLVTLSQQTAQTEVTQNDEKIKLLEQRLQDLKGQIVESPERIQQTLISLQTSVKNKQDQLKNIREHLPLLRAQGHVLQLFYTRLTKAENMLRSINVTKTKIEALKTESDVIDQNVKNVSITQADVSKKLDSLTKEMEKLHKADTFLDSSTVETQRRLDILRRKTKMDAKQQEEELEALEDANRAMETQLPKLTRDIVEMQAKAEELEDSSNQLLAHLQTKCHTLARKLYSDLNASVVSGLPPDQGDPFKKVLALLDNKIQDL